VDAPPFAGADDFRMPLGAGPEYERGIDPGRVGLCCAGSEDIVVESDICLEGKSVKERNGSEGEVVTAVHTRLAPPRFSELEAIRRLYSTSTCSN
jgi:hypothetical protein